VLRHAKDAAHALASRCYHDGANRTHYHVLKVPHRDYTIVALMLALLAAVLLLS
jgi:energy-coupling factor transporter transmembrane protein EcfT